MKNKLKIIIPIAIAVIAIMIAAFVIRFDGGDSVDIRSMMSTAQKYLVENNYEQAVMEYEAIINLEPNNAEAYLGIAEAYVGMGDTGKAIEWLEKGYALTGDDRLKNMIDELTDSVNAGLSDTSESGVTTAETTETEETTSAEPVLTEKQLEYCDGWYSVFSYDENGNIVSMILYNKSGEERMNVEYEYSGDDVHRKVYVDGAMYNESDDLFTDIMANPDSRDNVRKARAKTRKEENNNWWIYDENGECIENGWHNLDENGNVKYDSGSESYLKNGKLYKSHSYISDWDFTAYYDENGYITKENSEIRLPDGKLYTYEYNYTYDYDEYGYPVVGYKDGIKVYDYKNYYKGGQLIYYFERFQDEYNDSHIRGNGLEMSEDGLYLRDICHSTSARTFCTYYVPSYDGTEMIDTIFIDDTLLFECPYCNAE